MVRSLKNSQKRHLNKKPPKKSNGVFSDIRFFLLNKPEYLTWIKLKSTEDTINYRQRILQRIGMDTGQYSIFNLHKIGIDAPANYVFEELLNWNGDSTCWPNNIAKVDRKDNRIENIQILPFGFSKYPFGIKNGIFGFNFIPLFNMNAQKIQQVPDSSDLDNARYLLYKCSGGYPIGFFSMYARSSIVGQNEKEQTQLFMGVGFDFFGRKNLTRKHLIVKIWKMIHNRVTANVMNRFKQLCEWRFEKIQNG